MRTLCTLSPSTGFADAGTPRDHFLQTPLVHVFFIFPRRRREPETETKTRLGSTLFSLAPGRLCIFLQWTPLPRSLRPSLKMMIARRDNPVASWVYVLRKSALSLLSPPCVQLYIIGWDGSAVPCVRFLIARRGGSWPIFHFVYQGVQWGWLRA